MNADRSGELADIAPGCARLVDVLATVRDAQLPGALVGAGVRGPIRWHR